MMQINQYAYDPATDYLAEGAFAEVFRAHDVHAPDRQVALKIYREAIARTQQDPGRTRRYSLEQEFANSKGLSHTNIVAYHGLDYLKSTDHHGREAWYPVMVMEYAEDGNLTQFMKTNPDAETCYGLLMDIVAGVGYLHSQGMVHRDLKPGNILIGRDRLGKPVAKITDFGISKDTLAQQTIDKSATKTVGTPHYMAPEQFYKKRFGWQQDISPRTDIWSVGVLMYWMYTGQVPFAPASKDYEQIRDAITEETLACLPGQVTEGLAQVIQGCLQKHAELRYASMEELHEAMQAWTTDGETKVPSHHTSVDDERTLLQEPSAWEEASATPTEVSEVDSLTEPTATPKTRRKRARIGWAMMGLLGWLAFGYMVWENLVFVDLLETQNEQFEDFTAAFDQEWFSAGKPSMHGSGGYFAEGKEIHFTVKRPTVLEQVLVKPYRAGTINMQLYTDQDSLVASKAFTLDSEEAVYLDCDFKMAPDEGYYLTYESDDNTTLYSNVRIDGYPKENEWVRIEGTGSGARHYYYFYDWQLSVDWPTPPTPQASSSAWLLPGRAATALTNSLMLLLNRKRADKKRTNKDRSISESGAPQGSPLT